MPPGATWTVRDAWTFGETGLAVAGDGGHVAVTGDGGGTWRDIVVAGLNGTSFSAVALTTSGDGAVASGGLMLVTSDGGTVWKAATYIGPGPGAAIADIAMRGAEGVAVGDDGTILRSGDAGVTWQQEPSPTTSSIGHVALAGDGTAVAGAVSGEILVRRAGAWSVAGSAAGPVTAVAAGAAPVWGDGEADLFVASGADVLGSDDALTFASLPGLPDPSTQPWSALALVGVPWQRSLLIAGAGQAGFLGLLGQGWVSGLSGLGDVETAAAPAGQSVAYLLGSDGRLVRTLNAGRDPGSAALSRGRITVGQSTRWSATVRIAAPGRAVLRSRVPGRSWGTLRAWAWGAGDVGAGRSLLLKPALTQEYALDFEYGGTTVRLAPPAKVVVVPRIATSRSRYDLRRRAVFRFSGSVTPRLPGERVQLFTDRGGSWRPVSRQSFVRLVDGRTWTSRSFGTPVAEKYRLRARLAATQAHAAAWSRAVTVVVR